jgi:hypothetical protein
LKRPVTEIAAYRRDETIEVHYAGREIDKDM